MQPSASELGELEGRNPLLPVVNVRFAQSTERHARNDCSTYRAYQTGSGYEGFIFSNSAFV
jgi:hypothetical protein